MKLNPSSVKFCGIKYKNPIITCSGTFANAYEYLPFFNVNHLGGVTLKALTLNEKKGNLTPRVCETEAGMINSIGLQNQGLSYFKEKIYPNIEKKITTHTHINISGESEDDFLQLIKALNPLSHITFIELNVSCPNIKKKGLNFSSDIHSLASLVKKSYHISKKPLIVKLSPNVSSIGDFAQVCEDNGASGLSLVNTFLGMKIDIHTRKPLIGRNVGGYSGIGIKPIALRMVHEVYQRVSIPIIGMGGVYHYEDALEFILAGASLVGVGSATLVDPVAPIRIQKKLHQYLKKKNESVSELIGSVKLFI